MRRYNLLRALEATAVLLFVVQAVRVLFSAMFGIIYDAVFEGTTSSVSLVLCLLAVVAALAAPAAAPRSGGRTLLLAAAVAAALARIPLTMNVPPVRLVSGIVVVAAGGLYVAGLLRQNPRAYVTSLTLAFALDQVLRAAGDTYDVGLRDWWMPVQAALSLATAGLAWLLSTRTDPDPPATEEGLGLTGGLAVGGLLFLETSLLGFPNALARWTGIRYAIAAPAVMAFTLLPLVPGFRRLYMRIFGGRSNALFMPLLMLILLWMVGVDLREGDRDGNTLNGLVLLANQCLGLLAFSRSIGPRRRDRTGTALALGQLFFFVLNLALAFAFTYPYTVPWLREKGIYVFLVAIAVLHLPPALRVFSLSWPKAGAEEGRAPFWPWPAAVAAVLLTGLLAWPPTPTLNEEGPIRVGTYNIHYGYNTTWRLSLEEQARAIEESGASVVLLQEVDACRVTSFGIDDALWLARRLGMQEVFGPALEGLTGVALITNHPISASGSYLLDSQLEQTALVYATVEAGYTPIDVHGVWLGLEPEERMRQLNDAFRQMNTVSSSILAGDMNATPGSPIYARMEGARYEDPFVAIGVDPAPTSPAIEPTERIDYVWVKGLNVADAAVLDSLASDHRLVVVEVNNERDTRW